MHLDFDKIYKKYYETRIEIIQDLEDILDEDLIPEQKVWVLESLVFGLRRDSKKVVEELQKLIKCDCEQVREKVFKLMFEVYKRIPDLKAISI